MEGWGQIVHDYGAAFGVVIGFCIQALVLRGRRDSEIEDVQDWKKEHQKEAQQRDAAIAELSAIAASMRATAQGQDRRLVLLEERVH